MVPYAELWTPEEIVYAEVFSKLQKKEKIGSCYCTTIITIIIIIIIIIKDFSIINEKLNCL